MTVVDEHNARVACLGLDLRAPLVSTVLQLWETGKPTTLQESLQLQDETFQCPKPHDHLTNISHAVEDGWDVTTLTFDENITAATAIIKLKLFEDNSPRDRQATIPALFEPGITQGEVKIRSKNLAKGTQASEATLEPAIKEEQAQAPRVKIRSKNLAKG